MPTQIDSPLSSSSNARLILRNGLWLWAQTLVDILLAFAFAAIAVRWLGPANFGVLTLTQAVLNLAGLGTLSLELALVRFVPDYYHQNDSRAAQQVIVFVAMVKVILALLMATLLFFSAPGIAAFYHQTTLVLILRAGCLSLVAAALAEVGANACLAILHPEALTAMTTLRRLVEITGLLLVTALGFQVMAVVIVLGVADLVTATGYWIVVMHHLSSVPSNSEKPVSVTHFGKRILLYCLPLIGSRWIELLGREAGKLILGRLASPEVLGYYSVARLTAERMMSLLGQVSLATLPVVSRGVSSLELPETESHTRKLHKRIHPKAFDELNILIHRVLGYQWVISSLFTLGIWAVAPLIILLLGGPNYAPAIWPMRLLSLATLCWSATGFLNTLFLVREHTLGVMVVNLAQLTITLVFYVVLVPKGQASGMALAEGLGQFLTLGLCLGLLQARFGFPSGRVARALLASGGLLGGLVLPVGLWNLSGLGLMGWLVLALGLFCSYILYTGLPDPEAWQALKGMAVKPLSLGRLKNQLIQILCRYQTALQRWNPKTS